MTDARDLLLARLREIAATQDGPSYSYDQEGNHMDADDALIDYIDDAEIREAYEAIWKWYA